MLTLWMAAAMAADCTPSTLARAFAAAGDAGDAVALESLLHPEFRVVFTVAGSPETTVLGRETYLQMVREGQLGGKPRTFEVEQVRGSGALHIVSVQLGSSALRFASDWTVVRHEGRCQLIADTTVATPTPSP